MSSRFSQADQEDVDRILTFWFQEVPPEQWFNGDPELDQKISRLFHRLYALAAAKERDHWKECAQGTLALILLLDQFPRNMFRGDARAYETDAYALSLTKNALAKGMAAQLTTQEKHFLYLPLMHSEALEDQTLSLQMFKDIEDGRAWAQHHHDIVKKFGRFPHRNKILGRISTPAEKKFLQTTSFKI